VENKKWKCDNKNVIFLFLCNVTTACAIFEEFENNREV